MNKRLNVSFQLFEEQHLKVENKIYLMNMTPIEALTKLQEIQNQIK